MSCTITIHPDNSLLFEVTLTNPKAVPIYVNDATVTITLYDVAGNVVTGQVWPLTLDYEAGSDGVYSANVDPISGIVAGSFYKMELNAVGADGLIGHWQDTTRATLRECGA